MISPITDSEVSASFWTGLAAMRDRAGLLGDWEWYFASALPLVRPFLAPTSDTVDSCPCPADPPCGCRHAVRDLGSRLVAVCTCAEPGQCGSEIAPVEPAALQTYQIDRHELARSLCHALGIERSSDPDRPAGGCWPIGCYGKANVRVWLCLGESGRRAFLEAQILEEQRTSPCLLLTCAGTGFSGNLLDSFRTGGGEVLMLGDLIDPAPGALFSVKRSLNSALSDWLARLERRPRPAVLRSIHREIASLKSHLTIAFRKQDPVPDATAQQVFALLKELETAAERKYRKAPPVQVFRLYCLENLSAREVARRCGCAKSLIVKRLDQLRIRLGRHPSTLRQCSSYFEPMEAALTDDRARRISRTNAAYGEVEEDD